MWQIFARYGSQAASREWRNAMAVGDAIRAEYAARGRQAEQMGLMEAKG